MTLGFWLGMVRSASILRQNQSIQRPQPLLERVGHVGKTQIPSTKFQAPKSKNQEESGN
jgi:hypothetical protein